MPGGYSYRLQPSAVAVTARCGFFLAAGREVTEEPVKIVKIEKFKTGATCIGSNATSNYEYEYGGLALSDGTC